MLRAPQLLWRACVLSLAMGGGCDGPGRSAGGVAAGALVKPASEKPVADLFRGENVQLPPPLAGLKLGAPEAEAERVLTGITTELVVLDGYGGRVTVGSFTAQRGSSKALVNVRLSIASHRDDLLATITRTWGTPHEVDEPGAITHTWFNPDEGLRATLRAGLDKDETDVEYSAYLPFESLIGTDAEAFGFETRPLLGLDRAQLQEHYGDLHLLPTELESYTTTVRPTFDANGRIVAVRFTVPFEGEAAAKQRLMNAMKRAWGEPDEEVVRGRTRFVFSEDPFLVVEDSMGRAWEIEKKAERD